MTNNFLGVVVGAGFLAVLPAHSQDPAASLGKQRAVDSRLDWETREAGHPTLGDIRFAVLRSAVETPVGNAKIFSRAYLSCQKATRRFAIELTNTSAADDTGGLRPLTLPRLVCNRVAAPGDEKLLQEDLLANWEVSEIGDALASGFRAFPLRECVSIGVVQEVALPKGWAQKSARVAFEIEPYNRELDSIFVACGERSAYAPAPRPAPAKAVSAPWQQARVAASGKTNVRAGPKIQSALVTRLDPGAVILVQSTGSEWWRVKASSGAAFEGYIRQDRLVFK